MVIRNTHRAHQSHPDMPIDENELYLSNTEHDDKGRTYELWWTPSGSRRRHARTSSSQAISAHDEPIKLLRKDIIKEMQTNLLRVT
ncbi:hypothetical protein Syun_011669 [Stephania yunnanensis]|uniref:Uncharacterized protein n=1 Tax=Stephania yunnanensis TaxID=152371 RepID=A0AAP0PGQ5_9MAGN